MDAVTRRKFLLASGVIGAAALVDGASAVTWDTLMRRAKTDELPKNEGILVVVTLYGGNDGLNTVVPYADNAYHDQRKELAYDPKDVLKLDDQLGFNPGMKGMADLYKAGKVAVVRGVAYPDPKYSHFASMDIWQTGSPTTPEKSGWIGRYLDAQNEDPLLAIAMGSTLPPLAVGANTTASALPVGSYEPLDPALAQAARDLAVADGSDPLAARQVVKCFQAERKLADSFDSLLKVKPGNPNGNSTSRRAGGSSQPVTPDDNRLAIELDAVSRAVKAGVPTKVWMVSLGGFDFHANERERQQALWANIDTAVTDFFKALEGDPRADSVVMMVYSEFGRRVQANASQGTDHGSAGPMFVMGNAVKGGMHGEEPSLTDLVNGNMKVPVDFRAVYGEMLESVLGTDPKRVLDQVPQKLGVIRT